MIIPYPELLTLFLCIVLYITHVSQGNISATDIIKRLEKAKATKRNRSIGYTCASVKDKYVGMDVQLFFYCDLFGQTKNVINNNCEIKAVKPAVDRLDLAAAAA